MLCNSWWSIFEEISKQYSTSGKQSTTQWYKMLVLAIAVSLVVHNTCNYSEQPSLLCLYYWCQELIIHDPWLQCTSTVYMLHLGHFITASDLTMFAQGWCWLSFVQVCGRHISLLWGTVYFEVSCPQGDILLQGASYLVTAQTCVLFLPREL